MKIPVVRSLWRSARLAMFRRKWRKLNSHNNTCAVNEFPLECVSVGNGTYGELNILCYNNESESVCIGNYVSIAPMVQFIPGGNQLNTLFTYPIGSHIMRKHFSKDSVSKGPIVVDDDVWIGFGAIILSGVTLGYGCVVGAGAVVTHSVPPFAIVVGNPAKVVSYRFDNEVADTIAKVRINNISHSKLHENMDLLYSVITNKEQAENIVERLSENE